MSWLRKALTKGYFKNHELDRRISCWQPYGNRLADVRLPDKVLGVAMLSLATKWRSV
jgi:hypothetical protein